jgi:hypothetical protein
MPLGNNMITRMATGTIPGTGATIQIALEFSPRAVYVVNEDGLATLYWTNTMADASGLKEVTAGTKSFITTLGITPKEKFERDDTSPDLHGFEIGADTDVNVSAEVIHWTAWE